MTATIQLWGMKAAISGWEWTSNVPEFADMLNAMLDPDGPSGADPAPNYHAALDVVARLGGEVISYELPKYVEGTIY